MNKNFIKYRGNPNLDLENIVSKSNSFYENIKQRKTIREFSKKTFQISVIENCIKAAGTAPSGANMQPWHFSISKRNELRKLLRKVFFLKVSDVWSLDICMLFIFVKS